MEYEGDRPVAGPDGGGVHPARGALQRPRADAGHDPPDRHRGGHQAGARRSRSSSTRGIKFLINPTGRFVIGGPHGDAGLTGRKIIVDTYGGMARHGGGAFSGKDPSKVDRSAAYAMRWVAKNIVAAKLARRCEVQVAYAIGVAEPVSVMVQTFGTGTVPDAQLEAAVREVFDLTPRGIITALKLRKPIYSATAAYGHFGRRPVQPQGRRPDRGFLHLGADRQGAGADSRPALDGGPDRWRDRSHRVRHSRGPGEQLARGDPQGEGRRRASCPSGSARPRRTRSRWRSRACVPSAR